MLGRTLRFADFDAPISQPRSPREPPLTLFGSRGFREPRCNQPESVRSGTPAHRAHPRFGRAGLSTPRCHPEEPRSGDERIWVGVNNGRTPPAQVLRLGPSGFALRRDRSGLAQNDKKGVPVGRGNLQSAICNSQFVMGGRPHSPISRTTTTESPLEGMSGRFCTLMQLESFQGWRIHADFLC